jgi:hypothetical protein
VSPKCRTNACCLNVLLVCVPTFASYVYGIQTDRYVTDSGNYNIRKVHSVTQFVAACYPSSCSAGMFSAAFGSAELCLPCPRGYFCLEGARKCPVLGDDVSIEQSFA